MRYDSARVLARLIGKWYSLILISPNYALLFLFLLVLHSCTKTSNEPPSATDGKELRREDAVAGNRAGATNTPYATACDYENEASSLGVGLIIAPPSFTLWNDSATTVEYLSFSTTAEQPSSGVCPKFYEPEYGIIHFVWLASYSDAYAVLADSGTVKYIRKSTHGIGVRSWEDYILQSFGVRRKVDEAGNPEKSSLIRTKPDDNAPEFEAPQGHEMFCPMEIEGDWVKVRYDCFYNRDDNPHEGEPCHNFIDQCEDSMVGWLRWRKGNQLLIDIFLMP